MNQIVSGSKKIIVKPGDKEGIKGLISDLIFKSGNTEDLDALARPLHQKHKDGRRLLCLYLQHPGTTCKRKQQWLARKLSTKSVLLRIVAAQIITGSIKRLFSKGIYQT